MQDFMRRMALVSGLGLVAMLGACGDDDPKPKDTTSTTDATTADTTADTTTTPEETSEDTEVVETTYATLTFSIDDSANKTFDATDKLQWKGSFTWDSTTNILTFDASWGGGSGPYPLLYDDGPAPGGHEKPGATANDGIWTTVVRFATPTEATELEYGAAYGDGASNWIWVGANGKVTVPAGSTAQVDAAGLVIPAFGTVDLKLTIDVSGDGANLSPTFQGVAYTDVKVKGSAWGWAEIALVDDGTKGDATSGDKIYTFLLSENLTKHAGLLKGGDKPQFVFVLGGVEYKDGGMPPTAGVTAYLDDGTAEVEAEVMNLADGDKNTYVEVPSEVWVTFQIDDSANGTYEAVDELEWKGSFTYAEATNTITFDASWGGGAGPYAPVYDDGPVPGGHEPPGAVAGDHKWHAYVKVSNAATQEFEYGAQRAGDQWVWVGNNGKFTVNAGQVSPITAPGLTIAAHGTIDLRLVIDVSNNGANLQANYQGVDYTGKVEVKGSAWGWVEKALVDDGTKGDATANDGKYTFLLSEMKGKHDGLLKVGDQPQFVFVLDNVEYKAAGGAAKEGVTAFSDAGAPGVDACLTVTAQCVAETIETGGTDNNTMVTIGE